MPTKFKVLEVTDIVENQSIKNGDTYFRVTQNVEINGKQEILRFNMSETGLRRGSPFNMVGHEYEIDDVFMTYFGNELGKTYNGHLIKPHYAIKATVKAFESSDNTLFGIETVNEKYERLMSKFK